MIKESADYCSTAGTGVVPRILFVPGAVNCLRDFFICFIYGMKVKRMVNRPKKAIASGGLRSKYRGGKYD